MKILAFGEVMMRLTPPDYKQIEQTNTLDMSFNGTGVNILSGLSRFGYDTTLLTTLPDNHVGKAAAGFIRRLGIDDSKINFSGQHIGIYFLELGYGNRPSQVTYLERLKSSFGISSLQDYNINSLIDDVDIIHICGISLSLGEGPRETAIQIAKMAYEKGKIVCFDFNFRPSLNEDHSYEWMRTQYERILPYCTVVFGGKRDLIGLLDAQEKTLEQLSQEFTNKYQHIKYFAGSNRTTKEDKEYLSGFLYTNKTLYKSPEYLLTLYDRIGTGDAFAAGIITGIIEKWSVDKIIKFATSNSVLAHTTFGDSPVVDKEIVEQFMNNELDNVIR